MAATTTLLGLVTPTQGTLTGTWGDTVNYGITDYVDIAIAGTLSFAGDGAITLANTTGSSSGNSIGATTAQYAIIRVTGTLTTAKIITGPSYSKTYLVVNAATGSTVTFKASGQTGVSIAVGETALVYYNGTDYVKVVGTATAGAAGGSTTQVQYNNAGVLAGITGATTNGTALTLVAPNLGSPASVGTMPAFTLGGTVSGGGNQINNVVIGTTTPLAGAFTTLSASGRFEESADIRFMNEGFGIVNANNSARIMTFNNTSITTNVGIAVTGTLSSTLGATIQGLTVGLGAGAVATNTAVGYQAGVTNSTGSQHVFIGYQAGSSSVGATNVTAVGYQAASGATGSGITAIGTSAAQNSTGDDNIAVGASALLTIGSGANNTAVGRSALRFNNSASYNTAVGYQAGYTNTIGGVTAFGSFSLYTNSTGTNLTALGQNALYYCTVSDNTAVGYAAGFSTSTGQYNAFFGGREPTANLAAGQNNTLGSNNSAFGHGALAKNTTASNNTAIGYQAGYSQTTGSGSNALFGIQAGNAVTSAYNTMVGPFAGYLITSGSKNTVLGGYSGNQGGLDIRTASNYIVLSDGDGNPRGVFDNSGNFLVNATSGTSGGYGKITVRADSGVPIMVGNEAASGNFIQFSGNGSGVVGSITFVGSATLYNTTSDQRLKENIVDADSASSLIDSLQVRKFDWKSNGSHQRYGFVAQELVTVAPEAVHQPADTDEMMAVDYSKLVPMLVKELQSLRARVAQLESKP